MHHPVMGLEHLHRHSDFSLLDGFAKVEEYAGYQKSINQKYLCISDHGVMGAVPQQIAESEKHGLYPLFACEMYVNSMQPRVEMQERNQPPSVRIFLKKNVPSLTNPATSWPSLIPTRAIPTLSA
jgi:DNA polymerase III alpha subunit